MTPKPQGKAAGLSMEDKLSLVRRKTDRLGHIKVDQKKCRECGHRTCLTICPAKTYEKKHKKIEVAWENCLECGSCRAACTDGAIAWENPRGGFGVSFING